MGLKIIMKTNITITVIIACVAMIVLSGVVAGMNTMSNVSPTFDLTTYDPRTSGFTLGTTPTIPTPYSIEGTAMYEAAEVVEPKKISDKFISIWETDTKNIATQYFESMYDPSVVSPFSFEGMTGITPERKEPNMRILGASKKNFEEAKVVLETAHKDIYEISEVGDSFGNTLHTNDTELINEIFKQLNESALSTIEAKKLEKLEDYLKVGLSVSLPNMQDVKLNPKL